MDDFFLKDITVLSLEQAIVAPYLSYRLAQDGASVVRMENPARPDPDRYVGDNVLEEDAFNNYFYSINAGKKAVTLNLLQPKGRKLLERLIIELDVDIFITNQLPKNYEKLGIDYTSMSKIKKDLIWVGISGFGPDSNEMAYDPIIQARSGTMELTGEKDGEPMLLGIPIADLGTSENTHGLIMKALLKRKITGEGSRIDVSMFESTVSWNTIPICHAKTFNRFLKRRGNTHEFFSPVNVFKTKDELVYIAIGSNRQWKAFTSLKAFRSLKRNEYIVNEGRIIDMQNINKEIEKITQTLASDELIDLLHNAGIPVAKINTIKDVISHPLVKDNLLSATDHKTGLTVTLAPPPYLAPYLETTAKTLSFPPRVGEHNQEIYCDKLGINDESLQALKNEGIV